MEILPLLEKLKKWSKVESKKPALVLLDSELNIARNLTFFGLWEHVQNIAVGLQLQNLENKTVILLYENNLDFIPVFLACLYAKVIAVPVKWPGNDLDSIKNDAAASLILDGTQTWHSRKDELILPKYNPEQISHLQYTSGSTSLPKGVITTYGNIQQSLYSTSKAWGYENNSLTLNWAPHTHVYGLLCGSLTPLYNGNTVYVMPTSDFVKNPLNWLHAISKYQITHSGCPNFGYELCANQIIPNNLILDLKSWRVAVNGGESIQAKTLSKFIQKFSSYGFQRQSFCPAYGMSEFTGLISSTQLKEITSIVNCGKAAPGATIAIIDPLTRTKKQEGTEGEIWITGNALAKGYWQKYKETQEVFYNYLTREPDRHYLRTGDLGFIQNEQLFITGRVKELIIIHGKKYHPLDIEIAAGSADIMLADSAAAAFSVTLDTQENAILVQEIDLKNLFPNFEELCKKIQQVIMQKIGINLVEIVLVNKATIPRTSSGKIQRTRCAKLYLEQKLSVIYQHRFQVNLDVEEYLQKLLNQLIDLNYSDIDKDTSLTEYGIDSVTGIQLKTKIEERLNIKLPLVDFFSHLTVTNLEKLLRKQTENSGEIINKFVYHEDTQLSKWLNDNIHVEHSTPISVAKNYLLTGATGYLGAFLLYELLTKTESLIYCLIRSTDQISAFTKLKNNLVYYQLWHPSFESRIKIVLGDIKHPYLGLSVDEFEILADQIDVIIHNAANVNHLLSYQYLKTANVLSTVEVIRLAMQRKIKPIHFISTAAVCLRFTLNKIQILKEETIIDQGDGIMSGYAQTKWVSELLLEQSKQKNIPVSIYRCGEISSSTKSKIMPNDIFHQLLKLIKSIDYYCDKKILYLDKVPVNYVADLISANAINNFTDSNIYHVTYPMPLVIGPSDNKKSLPYQDWVEACRKKIPKLFSSETANILLQLFEKQNVDGYLFELYFQKLNLMRNNTIALEQKFNIYCPSFETV